MSIDQVLMPYWESLTLFLKRHYVKIKVWVGLADEVLFRAWCGFIWGSHLPQCLSPLFHCLTPACEGPHQYENDYWETVEPSALSSLPSFLHPTSFHGPKPKTAYLGKVFSTHFWTQKNPQNKSLWFSNSQHVTTIEGPCLFLTLLFIWSWSVSTFSCTRFVLRGFEIYTLES